MFYKGDKVYATEDLKLGPDQEVLIPENSPGTISWSEEFVVGWDSEPDWYAVQFDCYPLSVCLVKPHMIRRELPWSEKERQAVQITATTEKNNFRLRGLQFDRLYKELERLGYEWTGETWINNWRYYWFSAAAAEAWSRYWLYLEEHDGPIGGYPFQWEEVPELMREAWIAAITPLVEKDYRPPSHLKFKELR